MNDIYETLENATKAIKTHSYNFLYTYELQTAFRQLEREMADGTERDTLSVTIPVRTIKHRNRLSKLPLPVTENKTQDGDDVVSFEWFMIPEKSTGFAMIASEFIDALIHALDSLPEDCCLSADEIREIKQKYVHGATLRLIKMKDDFAPETGSEYEIEMVDDYGQIHVKGLGLAIIPGVDEFEVVQ